LHDTFLSYGVETEILYLVTDLDLDDAKSIGFFLSLRASHIPS